MTQAPVTVTPSFAELRRRFPGALRSVYMDVAARGLIPPEAKAAIDQKIDDRIDGSTDKPKLFETIERVRTRYAGIIKAHPDEIAFTKNVSEGVNIIAAGIDWQQGDNVVLCPELEHPSNVYPWLNLKHRYGVELRAVQQRDGRIPVDALAALVDGRTRVVTTSLVSFAPGLRCDIEAIGDLCARHDALFLVDGAQGIGILDIDMQRLPIGALAVSTQKGLLGLYGMGFLYVRRHWAERIAPPFLSRFSVDLGTAHEATLGGDNFQLMPGARRYDIGNYNFLGAIGVEPGLDIIASVGTAAIQRHVLDLSRRLADGFLSLGMPVFGGEPGPHRAHMVAVGAEISAQHDATDSLEMLSLYNALTAEGVRLSIRRGILRLSLHLYNNEEDVDRVIDIARRWQSGRRQAAD